MGAILDAQESSAFQRLCCIRSLPRVQDSSISVRIACIILECHHYCILLRESCCWTCKNLPAQFLDQRTRIFAEFPREFQHVNSLEDYIVRLHGIRSRERRAAETTTTTSCHGFDDQWWATLYVFRNTDVRKQHHSHIPLSRLSGSDSLMVSAISNFTIFLNEHWYTLETFRDQWIPLNSGSDLKFQWENKVKEDYSGRLQYICWNSFYADTPVHWCTIRG